jgi:hypothetical protein
VSQGILEMRTPRNASSRAGIGIGHRTRAVLGPAEAGPRPARRTHERCAPAHGTSPEELWEAQTGIFAGPVCLDGGADLFVGSADDRDAVRETYRAWLSHDPSDVKGVMPTSHLTTH